MNERSSIVSRLSCVSVVLCLVGMLGCSDDPYDPAPEEREHPTSLVVLGIDGMDHRLTTRLMRQGRLPNLAKLAERGTFVPLATTDPPQSPVAWSTFITGLEPDMHGIYDFVHRDTADMSPYLSTSKVEEPESFEIFEVAIPTGEATIESLRHGVTFWERLEANDVPVTVFKVPANFPPDETWKSETISGMGTPDLLGTYGTFQLFSTAEKHSGVSLSGGIVHKLEVDGQHHRGQLEGPPNPYDIEQAPVTIDVDFIVDKTHDVVLLRMDDSNGERELILTPGEWTEWLPVSFDAGLVFGSVGGMVRFYVDTVRPDVIVYASPINLDPSDPVMPIASPPGFAEHIAENAGLFYTQGMPEDTKALAADVLSDDAFLEQAEIVFQERLRLLDFALDRHRGGALFFYFSSIDQVSHVFWRTLDVKEGHELYRLRETIPELYVRMDAEIGKVMERLPEGTELMILSDHGFAPYSRKVHLNTWLVEQGFLTLLGPDAEPGSGALGHIDWSRTQAYALGLNQLFVNLVGREPDGTVPPAEREVVLKRLERALMRWRDPETGARVVSKITRPNAEAFPDRAPDFIVGFAHGYRSSDTSAVGLVTGGGTIEVNRDKWSGDHCMDARVVPGILFTSWTIPKDKSAALGLADMAPTILDAFGVAPADAMKGRSVWKGQFENAINGE